MILENKFYICFIPLILGIISSFSLPPYSFFFINFITFPLLLIFFISNYKKSRFISFSIGWIFGFGYFISSLYWLTHSLTFDEIFKPLIPFALILIPSFLGIFYGIGTLVCSLFRLNNKISTILIFSLIFGLVEYLRGFILGGFPWNLIVFSLTEYLPMIQILSFIGTYSLNLLLINIFLIPSVIFFQYTKIKKIILIFLSLILIILNFLYGSFVIKKDYSIDEKNLDYLIKIISPKIEIDKFFKNQDSHKLIQELIDLSSPNKFEKTIFIFPEGTFPSVYLEDLYQYSYLFSKNFSDMHTLILGINRSENEDVYNSLVVIDKDTNILSKYDKNKLVPFGEFLPYEGFLKKLGLKKITQGYGSYSKGSSRQIIEINGINLLPLICYEIIYSGKLNYSKIDYDLILNISEDGWFGDSIGPYQHFSHLIFRSIEEGKNSIRSANNGITAFINYRGEANYKIKSTERGVIELRSFKLIKKTFFGSNGNKIFFYFLLIYTSLIFFLKYRENHEKKLFIYK